MGVRIVLDVDDKLMNHVMYYCLKCEIDINEAMTNAIATWIEKLNEHDTFKSQQLYREWLKQNINTGCLNEVK